MKIRYIVFIIIVLVIISKCNKQEVEKPDGSTTVKSHAIDFFVGPNIGTGVPIGSRLQIGVE